MMMIIIIIIIIIITITITIIIILIIIIIILILLIILIVMIILLLLLLLLLLLIIIIIAAFIMRTYPSSEDVQGATYYYYPGRWIQFQDHTYSAQFPLPREHSLPSCLSWRYRQMYIHNISFTSYRVPSYTPGWRAAMWIKCLAE